MERQPKGVRPTTIRLDPDLLRRLTAAAANQACTRSALISKLLRDGVARGGEGAR